MTSTTIKVPSELRDQLKRQAQLHGRTLGAHLQALADEEARRDRFRAVQEAMTSRPPDPAYTRDAENWQSDAWS